MQTSDGYLTTRDDVRLFFRKAGNGPNPLIIPNGICLVDDFEPLAKNRTLIFYDLRNRGQSDQVTDPSKLANGIHHDVDDLEDLRQHFGLDQIDMIGHSYMGFMVILYAMKHGAHIERIVQIGSMQPNPTKSYPAHLTGQDETFREVFGRLAQLQKERDRHDPVEFCKTFWSILRLIYVVNETDADRITWGRCDLSNERNVMAYLTTIIQPSIQRLGLKSEDVSKVTMPVLTIHGREDRSAPYGGGREWALWLPNAHLVTVDDAGHAPWIEAPELVFGAIQTFLDGKWPESAEKVTTLDSEASKKSCDPESA